MRSMREVLKLVCTFLNGEEVEYVVVGGLAVLFYGIPRTTMDIDLIIAGGYGREQINSIFGGTL
jgi:hypothetical protein